jgi:hypothetical protein
VGRGGGRRGGGGWSRWEATFPGDGRVCHEMEVSSASIWLVISRIREEEARESVCARVRARACRG